VLLNLCSDIFTEMKQEIYQSGFFLMLGIIFGYLIGFNFPESTVQIEVVKDSVEVKSTLPDLTASNLKLELKKHNIPHANIVYAQAKLESGLGTSKVYNRTNNLFGLRKGNKYRSYSHWTECVKDYKRCISNRYKGGNYYAFLEKIKYAEDPQYTNKLKTMV